MADGRSVTVQLDRERHLRYDINALVALEQVLGINLAQPVELRQIGLAALRGFLWAGLRHEDPALTLGAAGDLLQGVIDAGGDVADLAGQMRAAMDAAGFKPPKGAATPQGAGPLASASGATAPSS